MPTYVCKRCGDAETTSDDLLCYGCRLRVETELRESQQRRDEEERGRKELNRRIDKIHRRYYRR